MSDAQTGNRSWREPATPTQRQRHFVRHGHARRHQQQQHRRYVGMEIPETEPIMGTSVECDESVSTVSSCSMSSATSVSCSTEDTPLPGPGTQKIPIMCRAQRPPRQSSQELHYSAMQPQEYTITDVSFWLSRIGMSTLIPVFQQHKIDGRMLCSMTGYDFVHDLKCSPYQANKIQRELELTIWTIVSQQQQQQQQQQQNPSAAQWRADSDTASKPRSCLPLPFWRRRSATRSDDPWLCSSRTNRRIRPFHDDLQVNGLSLDNSSSSGSRWNGDDNECKRDDSSDGDGDDNMRYHSGSHGHNSDRYTHELDELIATLKHEQLAQQRRMAESRSRHRTDRSKKQYKSFSPGTTARTTGSKAGRNCSNNAGTAIRRRSPKNVFSVSFVSSQTATTTDSFPTVQHSDRDRSKQGRGSMIRRMLRRLRVVR